MEPTNNAGSPKILMNGITSKSETRAPWR
jgi:hypothetical protein